MASDPSIYNQLGQGVAPIQQPPNIADVYAKVANAGNALMVGRSLKAKEAAGQAFQASINPDGTTNQAALLRNLASDPNAAMTAQESAQQGQTLSHDEYAQHMSRLAFGAQYASQVLADNNGTAPLPAMKKMFDAAVKQGYMTPADEESSLSSYGSDPIANASILKGNLQANVSAQQALTNNLPAPGAADVGNVIQPNTTGALTGPNSGVVTPVGAPLKKGFAPTLLPTGGGTTPLINGQPAGQAIPNTPTPGEQNDLVQTFNPQTRKFEYTPRVQVAPMVNGAGVPTPTSAVPGLPTTGRVTPGAATPTVAPQANVAKPEPGTTEAMVGSADHYIAASADANNYQQRINPVIQAQQALETADTGKASETLNNIRSYVQNLTPGFLQGLLPGALTDPTKVAAFDEANKYLTATALSTPGGTRSNEGQAAAQAASPSVHISPLAAKLVLRGVVAQQRMTQAGTLAFNQTGRPPADYDHFMSQWNTQQDPRGYIADQLTPEERASTVKSLGGVGSPSYQKFRNSYQAGLATQVVMPNGQ